MHRAKFRDFARFERHRHIVAQVGPLLPGKYPVGVILLIRCPNIHDAARYAPQGVMLKHDPEKRVAVFRKDHAQSKS
jgi:hypothetical protein